MKYHMVLAVEFFIVQGALFSDSDEDNNSQYWKTRYLSGSDYGSHYNLNHDSSKVNIHDHEVPSRTLFSWGPNDANIIKKNKTPSFFFENEQNPMSMDAMSQRNESNIWWPWSNYEEWASSRKRDSLVNNIRVIQSNKTNSPKSSSEEKKKKKKRKKKKKNKKNKKTSADTEPQQERELGSSSSKNTFFLTENYNVIESSRKSAKKMGLSVGDEDGYFNNENIPRHGKHKSVLTWKQDPAVVEKTPRGGWDNNEMDNEIHSRYNYQDAIPFKDSKNTLLDKIKKHRNVDSFIKGYSSRNFTDDINECLIDNGGCEGLCINTPGSYKCHCPDGFKLDISKCIDVNECLLRNGHGPCQGKCINQWGSYKCSCEDIPGTRLAKDGHTCEDVDECREGTAGCSHDCVNTVGSAFCLCPNGFMLGMDWKTCTDIDECAMPELQDERCIDRCENTIGSYRCL